MRFANPLLLLLLIIPIGYGVRAWLQRRRVPVQYVGFPALFLLPDQPESRRARWLPLLNAPRSGALLDPDSAGSERRPGDQAPLAQHHGRAGYLEQHEGG